MVQVLPPKRDFLSSFVESVAPELSGIGDALTKYAEQKKQSQALQKQGLGHLQGLPPEVQKAFLAEEMEKRKEARVFGEGQPKFSYENYKAMTPDQRAKFDEAYPAYSTSFRRQMTADDKANKPKDMSFADKERAKFRIKAGEEKRQTAIDSIPKLQNQVANVNHLRGLANGLRGPGGYLEAGLGSKDATEFNALGLAAIEAPLKLFNPVGAIPIAKIELIQKKFAPQASDLYQTQQGKLNAIERISQQALKNHQDYLDLFEKYDGDIPVKELTKLGQESEKDLDAVVKEEEKKIKEGKKEADKQELVSFDINNPEHIKRRDQILQEAGGREDLARQILNKEFKR